MLETIITIILAPVAFIALLVLVLFIIGVVKALIPEKKHTIYCGSEDFVEFAKTILKTTKTKYKVKMVDGEYEIEICK